MAPSLAPPALPPPPPPDPVPSLLHDTPAQPALKQQRPLPFPVTPDLERAGIPKWTALGKVGFNETVERFAMAIPPVECATYVQKLAVGAETENATPVETGGCASEEWWRRRESNPRPKMAQPRSLRA